MSHTEDRTDLLVSDRTPVSVCLRTVFLTPWSCKIESRISWNLSCLRTSSACNRGRLNLAVCVNVLQKRSSAMCVIAPAFAEL